MRPIAGVGQFDAQTEYDTQTWGRIGNFVADHPGAFTRDATIGGHITGSAFILSQDGRATLLTHHKKLGIWVQLGGHCDGIADARFVAMKEGYEESGLARLSLVCPDVFDVDIHEIPARKSEPAHLHYDIRFLLRAEVGEIAVSEESIDLAWVPLAQLEDYTNERSVLRMRENLSRHGLSW